MDEAGVCVWIASCTGSKNGVNVRRIRLILTVVWFYFGWIWYGHVSVLSSGLAKDHLARHCEGSKKKGKSQRQKNRWEDNIREWTGLDFPESQRAVLRQTEVEAGGCEIIGGAPKNLLGLGTDKAREVYCSGLAFHWLHRANTVMLLSTTQVCIGSSICQRNFVDWNNVNNHWLAHLLVL